MPLSNVNKIGFVPTIPSPTETPILIRASDTASTSVTAATSTAPEIHAYALSRAHGAGVIVPVNDLDKPIRFRFTLPTATAGADRFRICSPGSVIGGNTLAAEGSSPGDVEIYLNPAAAQKLYGLGEAAAPTNAKGLIAPFGHRRWTDVVVVAHQTSGTYTATHTSSEHSTTGLGRSATAGDQSVAYDWEREA